MQKADRVAVDVQTLVAETPMVAGLDALKRGGLVQLLECLEFHLSLRRQAARQNPVGSAARSNEDCR
jgi:hypothetical protein